MRLLSWLGVLFPLMALAAQAAPSVTLTWTDNSDNEDGFRIERKLGTGAWAPLATTAKDVATYVDAGPFTVNATYTYRVLAFNAWGDSAWSNEAGMETRTPGASGNLKITVNK